MPDPTAPTPTPATVCQMHADLDACNDQRDHLEAWDVKYGRHPNEMRWATISRAAIAALTPPAPAPLQPLTQDQKDGFEYLRANIHNMALLSVRDKITGLSRAVIVTPTRAADKSVLLLPVALLFDNASPFTDTLDAGAEVVEYVPAPESTKRLDKRPRPAAARLVKPGDPDFDPRAR